MIPGIIRTTQSITLLKYFTTHYFNKHFGSNYKSIDFNSKLGGVQNRCIATISYDLNSNIVQTKYFVKTHQQSSFSAYGDGILDPREIFVYIFLSKFSWSSYKNLIGPSEIHFFSNYLNPFDDFYIATKDVEFDTFDKLTTDNPDNFAHEFKTDNAYSNGLLIADLISKIFFLNDITNNPSNFGFTKDLIKKLKIVDFQISDDNLTSDNMLERFLTDNFSLLNKFYLEKYFFIKLSEKIILTKVIFTGLDINDCLHQSKLETLSILEENFSKYYQENEKYMDLEKKLNLYVAKVKKNFEKFQNEFKNTV